MKSYMQFLTHKINTHTYCIHNSTISYFLLDILEKMYYCVYCMCTYCFYKQDILHAVNKVKILDPDYDP